MITSFNKSVLEVIRAIILLSLIERM